MLEAKIGGRRGGNIAIKEWYFRAFGKIKKLTGRGWRRDSTFESNHFAKTPEMYIFWGLKVQNVQFFVQKCTFLGGLKALNVQFFIQAYLPLFSKLAVTPLLLLPNTHAFIQ